MRRSWIIVLVLAAVLVGAYAVTSSPLFSRKPTDMSEGSGLDYNLQYEDGKFLFAVKNRTEETKELEFMTSEHFRIIVKKGGETVFNSSSGMMFTQQINTLNLESGEQVTYDARWAPDKKGTFRVEAYFLSVSTDEPVVTMDLTVD